MADLECTFLIIGGGIAGVSCAETLSFLTEKKEDIILMTESSLIKAVTNLIPLGKILTRFDVEEKSAKSLNENIRVLEDQLVSINSSDKSVRTEQHNSIKYKFLCLCTGARPKLIDQAATNPNILGIRDTESVQEFQKRIKSASKIVIVGNGGIASEIVYEISGIQVEWVIKDQHITSTFVDSGAAKFFQQRLTAKGDQKSIIKRMRYLESDLADGSKKLKKGAALGPDWHRALDITGNVQNVPDTVNINYSTEIKEIQSQTNTNYPLKVTLTNGKEIECDFVVSATGVAPSITFSCDREFKQGPDRGIFVDSNMCTSIPSIYAAGDLCYAGWDHAEHWFQMRLWTQARQMGAMAGRSMAAEHNHETIYQDFCFELFNHVTQLFGYQVVLLGRYNGQGLNDKYEILVRITPNQEYIKYILVDGKLKGAILVGDTGLEETSENLILNQLDLTPYGDDLLNPDIDIEDYFD